MPADMRTDDVSPLLLEREFDHTTLKPLRLYQSGDDIGKGYHYTPPTVAPAHPRRAKTRPLPVDRPGPILFP